MNVKHYSRPTTIKIPDSVRTSFSSPKGRFFGGVAERAMSFVPSKTK